MIPNFFPVYARIQDTVGVVYVNASIAYDAVIWNKYTQRETDNQFTIL